jgi:co-chaperonin GroES (HSP10)
MITEATKLALIPVNDCILVELLTKHKQFSEREGKYSTRTEGLVVTLPLDSDKYNVSDLSGWVGKTVHFEEFKEGARINRNGKLYSFIKIEDVRGVEIV